MGIVKIRRHYNVYGSVCQAQECDSSTTWSPEGSQDTDLEYVHEEYPWRPLSHGIVPDTLQAPSNITSLGSCTEPMAYLGQVPGLDLLSNSWKFPANKTGQITPQNAIELKISSQNSHCMEDLP